MVPLHRCIHVSEELLLEVQCATGPSAGLGHFEALVSDGILALTESTGVVPLRPWVPTGKESDVREAQSSFQQLVASRKLGQGSRAPVIPQPPPAELSRGATPKPRLLLWAWGHQLTPRTTVFYP